MGNGKTPIVPDFGIGIECDRRTVRKDDPGFLDEDRMVLSCSVPCVNPVDVGEGADVELDQSIGSHEFPSMEKVAEEQQKDPPLG
jgi:hypothetical protein